MKASQLTIVATSLAVALVLGLGVALAADGSAGRGATVATAATGLGRVLVDGRGRTLYLFEKDRGGKSSCSGQCAGFWPPLIVSGKPRAASGVRASLLGTTKRRDGRVQVTYDHHPLYTFVKDTRKGQTHGEELEVFGGEWYAVSSAGTRVEKAGAATGGGYPVRGYGG
jgi:predicted lipoprotein with Yx(FWY)xxD motif